MNCFLFTVTGLFDGGSGGERMEMKGEYMLGVGTLKRQTKEQLLTPGSLTVRPLPSVGVCVCVCVCVRERECVCVRERERERERESVCVCVCVSESVCV